MGIECCLCGKKQNSWIQDYPLDISLSKYRICVNCNNTLSKLKTSKSKQDKEDSMNYIKNFLENGNLNSVVSEYITTLLNVDNIQEVTNLYKAKAQHEKQLVEEQYNQILTTTTNHLQGYNIIKYYGVITGETVLGMGFFKSFAAGAANFLGETSGAMIDSLISAKKDAMKDIKTNAIDMGANAIIGIDIDYSVLVDSMIIVSVSGTAVTIEKAKSNDEFIN